MDGVRAARRPSLNLAFIAPLTPFRHYVMGEASMERAATGEEAARIKSLLGEAMDAGAFGFSSTLLNQHMGYAGRPLACRNASREELQALCGRLGLAAWGREVFPPVASSHWCLSRCFPKFVPWPTCWRLGPARVVRTG